MIGDRADWMAFFVLFTGGLYLGMYGDRFPGVPEYAAPLIEGAVLIVVAWMIVHMTMWIAGSLSVYGGKHE